MHLEVRRIENVQDCGQIFAEWQELHDSIEPRHPYGAPLWNMLWWKHFFKKTGASSHEFFVHTVRDETGKLRAVAPWVITIRPSVGPFRLRILSTFGADQSLTEIRGVVCRKEDEPSVFAALDRYLRCYDNLPDAVEWAGIRTYDALDVVEPNGPLSFAQVNYNYVLTLPANWESLLSNLSSSVRKYFRRSREKFDELGKEMNLCVISNKAEVADAMERFFRLHSLRANAKDMFVHPDKFQDGKNRKFILEVFTTLAETDKIRIFELRVEDKVIACRLAFVLGSTLYIYYSGLDPEWKEYNVGTLLMIKIIQWAMKNGFKEVNLSAGKDRSKLQWKPTEHIFQGGVRIRPSFRGRVATQFYRAVNSHKTWRRAYRNYLKFTSGADR